MHLKLRLFRKIEKYNEIVAGVRAAMAATWCSALIMLTVVVLLSGPLPSRGSGINLQLRGGHAGGQVVGKGQSRRARKRRYWKPVIRANQNESDVMRAGADGDRACQIVDTGGPHVPKRERKALADGVQVMEVPMVVRRAPGHAMCK